MDEISEESFSQKVKKAKEHHEHLQSIKLEIERAIRTGECDLASAEDGNPRDEDGRTLHDRMELTKTQLVCVHQHLMR